VRIKFSAVTKDVKMSILESSLSSNPNILASLGLAPPNTANNNNNKDGKKLRNRLSTPLLRTNKSSQSLRADKDAQVCNVNGDQFTIIASPKPNKHQRGQSMDIPRTQKGSSARPLSIPVPPASMRHNGVPISPRSGTPGTRPGTPETPEVFVQWLKSYKSTDINMDVGRVKKLRMLLRNEVTTWVADFLDAGGYVRILERIQDLLDVEWRWVPRVNCLR
jgi:hypothetical protein